VSTGPVPVELADEVTFGVDTLQHLPSRLAELGSRRVLLVCGRRSFEASGAAAIVPRLQDGFEVHRWSEFRPNTDHADLVAGQRQLAEVDPDTIVGIGGGSAMDMAKLLAGIGDAADVGATIRSGEPVERRARHLVLAPTTSGSGAEATHFAVVYIGDSKFSVAGHALRPDAVIVDPSLTLSATAYQRATSGIDAVAQAIESLWASGATDRSRAFASQALTLLLENLRDFVDAPTRASAEPMALGSHLAGRAIDISKTTAAHALSYGITKRYGLSHGHAVAVTLGPLIGVHATAAGNELQSQVDPAVHGSAMTLVLAALGAADAAGAVDRFQHLCADIGLDTRLSAAGASDAHDRRQLAESVNVERLGNNPVRLGTDQLQELLRAAG
jgi:alcohol dehydrogenase